MRLLAALTVIAMTTACADRSDDDGNVLDNELAGNEIDDAPRQSIIRDEVRNEIAPDTLVEEEGPRRLTVGFPDGGSDLDDDAVSALEAFVDAEILSGDEPITLWGHSDSRGGEAPNRRAAQNRADAVAEWLVEKGVDEDRITTISLGSDNPIAPNALLDGSDNEEGQARNRRVDIMVGEMPEPDDTSEPSEIPAS